PRTDSRFQRVERGHAGPIVRMLEPTFRLRRKVDSAHPERETTLIGYQQVDHGNRRPGRRLFHVIAGGLLIRKAVAKLLLRRPSPGGRSLRASPLNLESPSFRRRSHPAYLNYQRFLLI